MEAMNHVESSHILSEPEGGQNDLQSPSAILQTQNLWMDIIQFLPDATFVIDKNGIVIAWNRAIERMTDVSSKDMVGKGNYEYAIPFFGTRRPLLIDLALQFDEEIAQLYPSIGKQGDTLYSETYGASPKVDARYFFATACVLRDANGEVIGAIESIRDITRRKQAEEQVYRLARFDPLTGLPNRALLADRVTEAIRHAECTQTPLAVFFLDLDHFKNINDTLGHRIGDQLLVQLANRLQSCVRERDTVARLGGDEFILLAPETDVEGASHIAKTIQQHVARPYYVENHELIATPSIGIAIYPRDGKDWETLSKCADIAMYRAKEGGRNRYCHYVAGS